VDGLLIYLTDQNNKEIRRKSEVLLVKLITLIKKEGKELQNADTQTSDRIDCFAIVDVIAITHTQYKDSISRKIMYGVLECCLKRCENELLQDEAGDLDADDDFFKQTEAQESFDSQNSTAASKSKNCLISKISQLLPQILLDISMLNLNCETNNDDQLVHTLAKKCNSTLLSNFKNWRNPSTNICHKLEKVLLNISNPSFKENLDLMKLVLQWLAIIGKFNKQLNNYKNADQLLKVVSELLLLNMDNDDIISCSVDCLCAFNDNNKLSKAMIDLFEKFPDERYYYILRKFFGLIGENECDDLFIKLTEKAHERGAEDASTSRVFIINSLLNRILQTSPELKSLRENMSDKNYKTLKSTWQKSKNYPSIFCLSLWQKDYQSAIDSLEIYISDLEIDDQHLYELEILVDYLESNGWCGFRVKLMRNDVGVLGAFKTLLAILPQESKRFVALKNRLILGKILAS